MAILSANLVALNFRVTGHPLQPQLVAPIRDALTPPDNGPRGFASIRCVDRSFLPLRLYFFWSMFWRSILQYLLVTTTWYIAIPSVICLAFLEEGGGGDLLYSWDLWQVDRRRTVLVSVGDGK